MEQKPRPWQQGEFAAAWEGEGEVGLSEDIYSTTFCWIRKLSGGNTLPMLEQNLKGVKLKEAKFSLDQETLFLSF